jgi:hypothetical protein
MPIIKFDGLDLLVPQATDLLLNIARFDACDLLGEFEEERRSWHAKLRMLQAEAERQGLSWSTIYSQAAFEIEIYESDREGAPPEGA